MLDMLHTAVLAHPLRCPACGTPIETIMGSREHPDVVEGVVMCVVCWVFLAWTPMADPPVRVLSNAAWAALQEPHRIQLTKLRDHFISFDVSRGTSQKGSQK
jgi:hypothetical protein